MQRLLLILVLLTPWLAQAAPAHEFNAHDKGGIMQSDSALSLVSLVLKGGTR